MTPSGRKSPSKLLSRTNLTLSVIYLLFVGIILRLFFWQVIRGNDLRQATRSQSTRHTQEVGNRGKIFTAEGNLLVGNKTQYHLMLEKDLLKGNRPEDVIKRLMPILVESQDEYREATTSAEIEQYLDETEEYLAGRFDLDSTWIRLSSRINQETKQRINDLEIDALYFEDYLTRFYPEASMAAHVTGFLGKNQDGQDTGYFGIEGALDKELAGKTKVSRFFANAFGQFLSGEQELDTTSLDGRDIYLTIHRDIQYLLEDMLETGILRYGAKAGEITVMDPKTGEILGLATWPKYDQEKYYKFDTELYKNPTLANLYEPGSTFKTITVSAGLDSEAVKADTKCPNCEGPRKIDKYTIKTWDNKYNPEITVSDALAKSDNIAMIFIAEELGQDRFVEYIQKFGIGEKIGLDLQDDTNTPFRSYWGEAELATTSFGQGISTNSMQMVRAVGAIANQGEMIQPKIISKVFDHQANREIFTEPKIVRRVISTETAKEMSEIMVNAATHGEAQWVAGKTNIVAGKTGTSQIPTRGGYKEDATIASFIGFAPFDNPKFVMLVKLIEPQSSPWAAETAAPLWYKVADRLFLLLSVENSLN